MKNFINFIVLICTTAMLTGYFNTSTGQVLPKNDPTWQLVFEDEFDSLGLDTIKWNQNDWRCGLYSYINQWNAQCETIKTHRTKDDSNLLFDTTSSGKVIIRTERDTVSVWSRNECDNPTSYNYHTFYYTTPAWLKSNLHFKYGYFEIRCRLPYLSGNSTSYGLGANFWLYENPAEWHDTVNCYSEIDIFEFLNRENENPQRYHVLSCNSHYVSCVNSAYSQSFHPDSSVQFADFHTFAMKWTPSEISYLKDDEVYFTSYNHPDSMVPLSIIVDVNLPTQGNYPDNNSLLPYDYEIDYVKVWQPRVNCDSIISCNFSDTNYNNTKVKNISIGGSGCTADVSSSGNVALKANEYIEFKEGFTVELGGEMSAETEPCYTPLLLKLPEPNRQPTTNEIPELLIKKFFGNREE